jgi:hypothetical protein
VLSCYRLNFWKNKSMLVGSVVIDTELSRKDHSSIPAIAMGED